MNKYDYSLIILIVACSIASLIFSTKSKTNLSNVYYQDELILQINMNRNKKYTVKGYLGEIVIEVKDKKIRVKKETSPLNLCSKQGFVTNDIPIICLPNKIVIKSSGEKQLDAILN